MQLNAYAMRSQTQAWHIISEPPVLFIIYPATFLTTSCLIISHAAAIYTRAFNPPYRFTTTNKSKSVKPPIPVILYTYAYRYVCVYVYM